MNYSIPASCPSVIGLIGERIRKYPTSSGEMFLSLAMISETVKPHIRALLTNQICNMRDDLRID